MADAFNFLCQSYHEQENSLVIPGSPVELVNIDQDAELKVVIDNAGSLALFFERQEADKALESILLRVPFHESV